MVSVPRDELERRHGALRRLLDESEPAVDAVVVLQKTDLYYLTGTIQQGHFLLPREGSSRLLVRKVVERAREDSALDDVRSMRSLKELREQCRELCGPPPWRIGMELDVMPVNLWNRYRHVFGDDAEIVDVSAAITRARSRKSEWEVEQFRQAAEIHARIFAELPHILREDISTYEVQTRLERRACELGHCGIIRMRGLDAECTIGLVVSGAEGAVPSHSMFPIGGPGTHPWVAAGGSFRALEPNTPIILDYLMSTTGYHADCSRMAVKGEFPDEATEIFQKIEGLLRFCEERLEVGAVPSQIYQDVVERAADEGLADGFMGPTGYQVPFVGHAVGLEVNETPVVAPRFDEPLVEGNTLAIEPKYTHSRWGVIGLENTYWIKEGGPENLTDVSEDVIRSAD